MQYWLPSIDVSSSGECSPLEEALKWRPHHLIVFTFSSQVPTGMGPFGKVL
jgi:hypothetical protein